SRRPSTTRFRSSARFSSSACPRTLSIAECPCCHTRGTVVPSASLNALGMIVRPSEHWTLARDAYPLKSAFIGYPLILTDQGHLPRQPPERPRSRCRRAEGWHFGVHLHQAQTTA